MHPDQVVTPGCVSIPELQVPPGSYPSHDCTAASPAFDGFVGAYHVHVRTQSAGADTWVCAAVDDGVNHIGTKLAVAGLIGSPKVDGEQPACSAPANVRYRVVDRALTVGPTNEPVRLEVNRMPGQVWLCLKVTNQPGLAQRVVLDVALAAPLTVLYDAPQSWDYPDTTPNPLLPSSSCQLASGSSIRVVDATIAGTRVSLYAATPTAARVDVCARIDGAIRAGGRVRVDAAGWQNAVSVWSDLTPCTFNVITDGGPPAYSVRLSPPANGVPASACVSANGTTARVTVTSGGAGVATWTPDP